MNHARLLTDFHVYQFLLIRSELSLPVGKIYLEESLIERYRDRMKDIFPDVMIVPIRWKKLMKLSRLIQTLSAMIYVALFRYKRSKDVYITSQHNQMPSTVRCYSRSSLVCLSEGFQDSKEEWMGFNVFYSKWSYYNYRITYEHPQIEYLIRQALPTGFEHKINLDKLLLLSDLVGKANSSVLNFFNISSRLVDEISSNHWDLVILTQPLFEDGIYDFHEILELEKRMIHIIRSKKAKSILYKRHPRESRALAFMSKLEVFEIPQDIPIELVASVITAKTAVTYYSSSLASLNNIKEKVYLLKQ